VGALLGAAAIAGASAVGLGAFGAHALKARLLESNTLTVWETAVQYHLLHAVALLSIALWVRVAPAYGASVAVTGWLFVAGIVLFSGSLYGLALGGPRWLGPVTPLGGLVFIVGWLWLLKTAFASDG